MLATIQNGDAGLFAARSELVAGRSNRHLSVSPLGSGGSLDSGVRDGFKRRGTRALFRSRSLRSAGVVERSEVARAALSTTEYERWQLWTISYPDGKAQRFTNDLSDYDQPLDIARDRSVVVAIAATVVSNVWEALQGTFRMRGSSRLANCRC